MISMLGLNGLHLVGGDFNTNGMSAEFKRRYYVDVQARLQLSQ
jgi:hypothetical protein